MLEQIARFDGVEQDRTVRRDTPLQAQDLGAEIADSRRQIEDPGVFFVEDAADIEV
ncbi:hypothetical protein [Novosphingobium sp. ST904]|uniref:hypothetical protein n=1 Tax=Novosphingobium sp. ST904 TaxID=1684385 RepID=UPI001E584ADB|nr:hypothetical protein [Novosphingobium sp. ST904]